MPMNKENETQIDVGPDLEVNVGSTKVVDSDGNFDDLLEIFTNEIKLVDTAHEHVDFLRRIHPYVCGASDSHPREVLEHSLYRYLKLWLPLLLENASTDAVLVAPVDIAWLWHAHRLSPKSYAFTCCKLSPAKTKMDQLEALKSLERRDSVFLFSAGPEDLESSNSAVSEHVQTTLQIWQDLYGTKEAFWLDVQSPSRLLALVHTHIHVALFLCY